MNHETFRLASTPDSIVVECAKGLPRGDLFANPPDSGEYPLSALSWRQRAERTVAAFNALAGVDLADMAQLVEDGRKWRQMKKDTIIFE